MMDQRAASAANRFGLGARGDEIARIGDDPRAWLLARVTAQDRDDPFAGLPDSGVYLDRYHDYLRQRREMREQQRVGKGGEAMQANGRRDFRRAQQREFVLRQRVAASTTRPFAERLVRFWSNHFAISVDKFQASLFAGPMEREAIRPHRAGRFADMLLAVERHPGMLVYLDNAQSIGDDSRLGVQSARRAQRNPEARKRGLNENLAREILELHTIGVDGGYAQGDVAELARAITGWSVARPADRQRRGGDAFVFRAAAHEQGARRVLGTSYPEAGEGQGEAILRDLALHPATARHLSLKLARHFVADWGGPDALFKRVQAAQALAERLPAASAATPQALGQAALGSDLDAETATSLRRAESVQQGVALLLASPVFQRRR